MIAAAMESKRLGAVPKSLFVVPNHLTEQWASDFLRHCIRGEYFSGYKKILNLPTGKVLFQNRNGDYDAVIIGHSQFEKEARYRFPPKDRWR